MATKNFTTTMLVDKTPKETFNAINNVRGWWSTTLKGTSDQLDGEFIYQHKEMHKSTQRVKELIPNEKVTWLVTESNLSFTEKKDEWNNTTITFDISKKDDQTQIVFTHNGLVPSLECFNACSGGWNYYLHQSLVPFINTGKGQPD